jgi:hypothetical protein
MFAKENAMNAIHPSRLLKFAFFTDALVSGAVALLQLLLPGLLSELLLLPALLLRTTGIFLIGYTVLLVALARSEAIWKALVLVVVAGNVLWAIGCAALPLEGVVAPSGLGVAFLWVQALAVLAFAAMQLAGLRSSAPVRMDGHAGRTA